MEGDLGKSVYLWKLVWLSLGEKEGHLTSARTVFYLVRTHTHTQKLNKNHKHAHMHRPLVTSSNNYSQHNPWLGDHSVKLEGTVCCYDYKGLPRRSRQIFPKNHWCRVSNLVFWSWGLQKMRVFKAILSLDYQKHEVNFCILLLLLLFAVKPEKYVKQYKSSTALWVDTKCNCLINNVY